MSRTAIAAVNRQFEDAVKQGDLDRLAGGTASVKFVVVWKMVDGQWRLHRDIWNSKGA